MTLEERIEYATKHPERPDFSINSKQAELLQVVLDAAEGNNDYKFIAYGGSMRGGKSYGMLAVIVLLCAIYPKSRWVVISDTYNTLKLNTVKTLTKIIGSNPNWSMTHGSPAIATYMNGSHIIFMSEDIQSNPDLEHMQGLECNGIMLEECGRLSEKLFNMSISRIGSWRALRETRPLLLCTFNPTQNFIKDMFYIPWKNGTLKSPYYYINAMPSDNPTNTKEQVDSWKYLDERTHRIFVEGDWTDMTSQDDRFFWAFDRTKHIATSDDDMKPDKKEYLHLSFDFNVNPICCMVSQHTSNSIRIMEMIKLSNSDIYKLCDVIKAKYPNFMYIVTGDSSGQNASALTRDNMNYYKIIKIQFGISDLQFKLTSHNPRLEDNAVLCNSILSTFPYIKIDPVKASGLVFDMENCKINADGSIRKGDRKDVTMQWDAADTFRYMCNTHFAWWTKRTDSHVNPS